MALNVIPDILHFIRSSDFASVLQFLQTSGYGIIFIIMIIEGPIITYIAAFASSLGIFNIFYVLILSVLGDVIGDLALFFIGRMGKQTAIEKYENKHLNPTKMSQLKMYLEKNPGKTIATIKLTPFLPIPGLILAGASNIRFKQFVFYSVFISLIYCLAMIVLGFYSGVAFLTIAKYVKYVEYLVGGTILLIVGVYFLIKFISKKVSNKIGKI